jgi:hypothetical protein
MKGIKECLNWLVDNPMKELTFVGNRPLCINNLKHRFNYNEGRFQTFRNDDWHSNSYFADFECCDWKEVKQPYTFEEAYKMCKEEGVEFYNEYEDELTYVKGDVLVTPDKSDGSLITSLSCSWYKL